MRTLRMAQTECNLTEHLFKKCAYNSAYFLISIKCEGSDDYLWYHLES